MAAFRRNRVHFLFYAVGADDPVRPQETSIFTENRCEIATFSMGRCRHRPLHPTTKIQRILKGGQGRPPLQMTVKNRTGHAKTAAFPILRRRGRCPHRPAGNDRFMAAFRRNRVHFLFYAVGADDPVRPPENALFHVKPMRNRNIFNGPMWASSPTNGHENSTNFEGGQSRPPLQITTNNHEKTRRLRGRKV